MFLNLAVISTSVFIFFRRINAFPLRNWDEAWYAEAVKNMASGQYGYIMQFWNGRHYFDHSPLYFWLSSPFFRFFGPGEWQARIISATSAVFATWLVFLICKRLVGARAGLIGVSVFLTLGGVVIRFSHGNLDSLLICLSLSSFYFYLRARERFIFSVLCGVSIGLGVLVKSWGIGLFPVYLIFVYSLWNERKIPPKSLVVLLSAFLACAWWYVLGTIEFGRQFIDWFIFNPSEGRLDTPLKNFSLEYFKFAINDIGFWMIPFVLYIFVVKKKDDKNQFVFPFLLVSISYIFCLNFLSDKSGWYLITIYPLLAIVIGACLDRLIRLKQFAFVLVLLVFVAVGWWNVLRVENIYPDRSKVGADLGVVASKLIPADDEVILEDHDFTSFLYYSNQKHIFTLQENRKSEEWWILSSEELTSFLSDYPRSWIVTRTPQKYPEMTQVSASGEYYFLRNY